jgi:putative transposase
MRKGLVEPDHSQLSIRRQCALLAVNRNRLAPPPPKATAEDLQIMRQLDELHLREPCFGARRMSIVLGRDHGLLVSRKRAGRLMRLMGLRPCWPRPRTSLPRPGQQVFPYLLRDLAVTRPNQVWCADITYIPMAHGFCYLMAVMDWYSRKVLGWAVSTTMDVHLCLAAFRMAVRTAGRVPEIMNTDQGSQFTSAEWLTDLRSYEGLKISMDGQGRWVDNVFIERLWWSLKYEDIYLKAYASPLELERGVADWFSRYNGYRPHSALGGLTPDQFHATPPTKEAA